MASGSAWKGPNDHGHDVQALPNACAVHDQSRKVVEIDGTTRTCGLIRSLEHPIARSAWRMETLISDARWESD